MPPHLRQVTVFRCRKANIVTFRGVLDFDCAKKIYPWVSCRYSLEIRFLWNEVWVPRLLLELLKLLKTHSISIRGYLICKFAVSYVSISNNDRQKASLFRSKSCLLIVLKSKNFNLHRLTVFWRREVKKAQRGRKRQIARDRSLVDAILDKDHCTHKKEMYGVLRRKPERFRFSFLPSREILNLDWSS